MSDELITVEQEDQIKTRVGEVINSLETDTDRDALVKKVRSDYEAIVQALIDSAKGMWLKEQVEDKKTGSISARVYQMKPNTDVAQYLLNQLIGKPKETQVMEGRVHFELDV